MAAGREVNASAATALRRLLTPSHRPASRIVRTPPQDAPMTIQIGERIPEVPLQRIREGVETIDTNALFDGRNIVLFAVPGAFTPTCSEKHLPGFVQHF